MNFYRWPWLKMSLCFNLSNLWIFGLYFITSNVPRPSTHIILNKGITSNLLRKSTLPSFLLGFLKMLQSLLFACLLVCLFIYMDGLICFESYFILIYLILLSFHLFYASLISCICRDEGQIDWFWNALSFIPGLLQTYCACYAAQNVFELLILLLLPSRCWAYRWVPHTSIAGDKTQVFMHVWQATLPTEVHPSFLVDWLFLG